MEESWDEVAWESEGKMKEWYVEYIAIVNEQKYHHMTILYGDDIEEAQKLTSRGKKDLQFDR